MATCPTLTCSTHGTLLSDATCQCEDGWSGQFCENSKLLPSQINDNVMQNQQYYITMYSLKIQDFKKCFSD